MWRGLCPSRTKELIELRFRNHFEVYCASNGEEGYQLFLGCRPDLVITDVAMPRTPGQHGNTKNRYTKVSDYKRQLLEKQRLRCQYNIHERQMKNYYNKAVRKSGSTSDNLIQMLETRLDAVVLRGGLARTIYAARQYVNHGHILVNGRRVDIPSCQVRATDVVSVRPKSRRVPCFTEAMRSAKPPAYLDLNKPEMAVTLLYIPPRAEIPAICEMPLVIEFYSR